MFWEYAQWLGFTPESTLTLDFLLKALTVASVGLLLVFAGFKLKGTLGAILALLLGAVLYVYFRTM